MTSCTSPHTTRLDPAQFDGLHRAFQETFAAGSVLFLFGSRTDFTLRGGDIDLGVEVDALPWKILIPARITFLARLTRVFGERRIDLVIHRRGDPLRHIDRAFLHGGVELCRNP